MDNVLGTWPVHVGKLSDLVSKHSELRTPGIDILSSREDDRLHRTDVPLPIRIVPSDRFRGSPSYETLVPGGILKRGHESNIKQQNVYLISA
ncbi:hypothetical protein ACJ72_02708 [Emergomyces africanus]|uniref:Uncharacterized protein n=1 Tax=Emergomyces africanus TaxID=1955775 RepID=A0A1B7P1Q0_9EURO|nr:hypothetical protein ACJ72_02708 [Emergomyces africanus]